MERNTSAQSINKNRQDKSRQLINKILLKCGDDKIPLLIEFYDYNKLINILMIIQAEENLGLR